MYNYIHHNSAHIHLRESFTDSETTVKYRPIVRMYLYNIVTLFR